MGSYSVDYNGNHLARVAQIEIVHDQLEQRLMDGDRFVLSCDNVETTSEGRRIVCLTIMDEGF